MSSSDNVVAIRECDSCGERKLDVKPDGCGAFMCDDCAVQEMLDAEHEYESFEDPDPDDAS